MLDRNGRADMRSCESESRLMLEMVRDVRRVRKEREWCLRSVADMEEELLY